MTTSVETRAVSRQAASIILSVGSRYSTVNAAYIKLVLFASVCALFEKSDKEAFYLAISEPQLDSANDRNVVLVVTKSSCKSEPTISTSLLCQHFGEFEMVTSLFKTHPSYENGRLQQNTALNCSYKV
jgi:hypothetical protein